MRPRLVQKFRWGVTLIEILCVMAIIAILASLLLPALSSVEYRPFAATDPLSQPAIIVYPSQGSGSGTKLIVFTIGDLIAPP